MRRIFTLFYVFLVSCCSCSIFGQDILLHNFQTTTPAQPALVSRYGNSSNVFSLFLNPKPSVLNTTPRCAKVVRTTSNWYELFAFDLGTAIAIPANTKKYLHMKVNYYVQPDISIRIDAANSAADGTTDIRALNTYTNLGNWQDLVFELDGGATGRSITALVVLPDLGFNNVPAGLVLNNTDKFGYIDQIIVNNSPQEQYGFSWTGVTSTDWSVATNWYSGIVPNLNSAVTIAAATNQPVIATNANANSLTIASGATLSVTANNLTVTGSIANSGTMTLNSNANLIQGGTTNTNTGNITVNRNSNLLSRLDYTLWSSPVAGQNLSAFSPLTDVNRFYNYDETTNLYSTITDPSVVSFAAAAGYLVRMPNNAVVAPATQNFAGVFTGLPNNGTITKAITYNGSAVFGYNMIGNPYPSTIDAQAFITANTANIESSLYFWRKVNAATGSAYAVYTPMGATTASASSAIPNGIIQVGQGFFVQAKSNANVTFTNAMRIADNQNQIFRTQQLVQQDRLWLNLTNTSGVFSQTLLGYTSDATVGVDTFDGKYINDSKIALTSNINGLEYTIQGRPAFNLTDVVSLNFKTDVAGTYTIALDHFDGLFAAGQDVYLVDSKTGTVTNLKVSAYTFTALTGIDNTRFNLKYQRSLSVNANELNSDKVSIYKDNGTLYVNSESVAISNIKVYDIQGRLIFELHDVKANTAAINNLKANKQVLVLKITGVDNSVVTKKVVN